jgi:iturin family lipopeptide synthetase B
MLDMHHIIADGASAGILIREFTAFYPADNQPLPPFRIQYKDFSGWTGGPGYRMSLEKQRAYWLSRFSGDIPVLDLPTDYPRERSRGLEGKGSRFNLTVGESFSLKQLAKQEDVTVYMVFLAIYNILLTKLSGREDIVIGTPVMGRPHEDLQPLIGMFVNTLALRNYPVRSKNFREFLQEIKKSTLEAFDNQEYPFDDLVEDAAPNRDAARHPLFDVMFTLQNFEIPGIAIPGLKLEPYCGDHPVSRFDLSLTGVETDERFLFLLQYRTALFKKETIERLAGYFKDIVAAVLGNPTVKLGDIDISDLSSSKLGPGIKREIHEDFDF